MSQYDPQYPDSDLNKGQGLHCSRHTSQARENIQQKVLKLIDESQKNIALIHPYYNYPVKKFERERLSTLWTEECTFELHTSAKEDQPVDH